MNIIDLLVQTAFANGVPVDTVPSGVGQQWESLGAVFYGIMNVVFYVGIALTVIFLIMGGIRYITSGGDKEGAEAARSMITNAIIGFIVVLGAFAIRTVIAKTLGDVDITLPGWFGGSGGETPIPTPTGML